MLIILENIVNNINTSELKALIEPLFANTTRDNRSNVPADVAIPPKDTFEPKLIRKDKESYVKL